jgi:hypothetical protein
MPPMSLAHGFTVPLRFGGSIRSPAVGDDVTAFGLIVAPKCPYTAD